MRGCTAAAALLLCMLSATASAQDGLRSASLPERPRPTAIEPRDLFRVDPGFYERSHDRDTTSLWLPYYGLAYGTPVLYPAYSPVQYSAPPLPTTAPPRAAAVVPAVDLPPVLPGLPKTFYVITGCYAGDKPPNPASLRAGCDLATLRVIPPTPGPGL